MQPLSQRLGEPQPGGGPSVLQSLLSRACSMPMTFEDPASVRRLTLLLYETRIPCSSYFVNFATALQAIDGPVSPRPVSPVLARTVLFHIPLELCAVLGAAATPSTVL